MRRRPRRDDGGGLRLYATCPAGLEEVLAAELRRLGARDIEPAIRGVAFRGDRRLVYAANLRLRTAQRVLVELATFPARDRIALYQGAKGVDWEAYMRVDNTLAVDAVSNRSQLTHTQFVARVIKDAVVDGFRERHDRRPSVNPRGPDLQINARLHQDHCTLSIDTSGERLNRRGYRALGGGGPAPLQETLAAGMLMLSGYDGSAPLLDPMCGSGTLLVEAALIARDIAPGLLGRSFGFERHRGFQKRLWEEVVEETRARARGGEVPPIVGSDISGDALRAARAAVQGAGVDDLVRLRRADVADLRPRDAGQVVTNPPYGERLGEMEALAELYRKLGDSLKRFCTGMTAHLLTGSKYLSGRIGLHAKKRDILWNGAIECRLLHYDLY